MLAGGAARAVLELAGVKDIRAKSLRSNNKRNVVSATIQGLSELKQPEEVKAKRQDCRPNQRLIRRHTVIWLS